LIFFLTKFNQVWPVLIFIPIIIPIAGITRVVENSLNYAKSLSPQQIIAVHISFDKEEKKIRREMEKVTDGRSAGHFAFSS